MPAPRNVSGPPAQTGASLTATHWSVVLAAGDADSVIRSAALERLCRTYWEAVHAFARQRIQNSEDARDLTQGFFAAFIGSQGFSRADRTRGRFRTFLLQSVKHYITNEWRNANAAKRGGGAPVLSLEAADCNATPAATGLTPEQVYEKRWAIATIEQAVVDLENEYRRSGRSELFERLRLSLWDEAGEATYAEVAVQLGMSEAAVKMAVSRLRARARELLRQAVANTVAGAAEIEEEFQYLLAVVRR